MFKKNAAYARTAFSVLSLAALATAPLAVAARAETVMTTNGPVKGKSADGVVKFLGIPYAAPPVGNLRWMPPQAPASWTAPIDATKFGNTCPQNNTLGFFAKPSSTEDCLYLNVFTARSDLKSPKPVMVWIHGGGLFDGESNDYNGSKLVKDGNTVVVTFNYRLGVLGYFAAPEIDSENHLLANYGLMDQQFALQWVKANIAAFGGDPNNVTIFGESAGGNAVYANVESPLSAGLFQKGIVESGGYEAAVPSLAVAESVGSAFATAEGCSTASCLRSLSVKQVLAFEGSYEVGDIVDGKVIAQSFDTAFQTGAFNRVPLISGTNLNEGTFFVAAAESPYGEPLRAAQYSAALVANYKSNWELVAKQYKLKDYANPSEALADARTSSIFDCTGYQIYSWISKYVPLYVYEFADVTAPSYVPSAGFDLKAAHTFEIQFLFPHYHGGLGIPRNLNSAQSKLSQEMIQYWTNFARAGDPNPPAVMTTGLTDWPLYVASESDMLSLRVGKSAVINNYFKEHNCGFWATIQTY